MTPQGHYYASVLVEDGIAKPEPQLGKAIGLDVSLNHLVVTSDSAKHNNPKWLRKHKKKPQAQTTKVIPQGQGLSI